MESRPSPMEDHQDQVHGHARTEDRESVTLRTVTGHVNPAAPGINVNDLAVGTENTGSGAGRGSTATGSVGIVIGTEIVTAIGSTADVSARYERSR